MPRVRIRDAPQARRGENRSSILLQNDHLERGVSRAEYTWFCKEARPGSIPGRAAGALEIQYSFRDAGPYESVDESGPVVQPLATLLLDQSSNLVETLIFVH